jgi:hypothetical protein
MQRRISSAIRSATSSMWHGDGYHEAAGLAGDLCAAGNARHVIRLAGRQSQTARRIGVAESIGRRPVYQRSTNGPAFYVPMRVETSIEDQADEFGNSPIRRSVRRRCLRAGFPVCWKAWKYTSPPSRRRSLHRLPPTQADVEFLVRHTVLRLLEGDAGFHAGSHAPGSNAELPVWHLGGVGALHRRDIYDDVR